MPGIQTQSFYWTQVRFFPPSFCSILRKIDHFCPDLDGKADLNLLQNGNSAFWWALPEYGLPSQQFNAILFIYTRVNQE